MTESKSCPRCGDPITKTRVVIVKRRKPDGRILFYTNKCFRAYCDPCAAKKVRAWKDAKKAMEASK